jgi:predicted amidohydrolase/glycerophosphoryl diester phosphodiesterase
MRIALIQPAYPTGGKVEKARACIAWMVERLEAMGPGDADLVLLPEYATAPGAASSARIDELSSGPGAALLAACRNLALRAGCVVAVGAVAREASGLYNRTLLFGPDGQALGHYDKTHLPDAESDDLTIQPGGSPRVVEACGLRLGFATCFDVYFPEWFAALAAAGVDLILSPSYQRSETADRLRLMSACRALDTGAWFARASYAMPTPGRGGHSLIAGPDGTIVADAGEAPGVLIAEIDPARRWVKPASHGKAEIEHRALLAAHRRPDLYRPRPERAAAVLTAPFPRLCAHRGLSHACPENTLPAFAAAIATPGVHELELDLWLSRDGVPVVCHDPRVDRTTDGQGIVTDLDWSVIATFDAGIRHGEAWRGIRLPRFEEVLDLVAGRVGINIHIKDAGPGGRLVHIVADLLRRHGMDRLGYLAGDEDVLAAALSYAPDMARNCLAHQGDTARLIAAAVQHRCSRLQFGRNVTAAAAAEAKARGLVRNLFWSDEVDDARRYAALGIDVILTNCAHQLAGRL